MVSHIVLGMTVANGCVLLFLQFVAWRRNKHLSFCLLATSTVFALLAMVLFASPGCSSVPASLYLPIYVAGALAYFVYMVLGLWGVVSLFRSYASLAGRELSGFL